MKKQKYFFLFLLSVLMLGLSSAYAQNERIITGRVTDDDGNPVRSVRVVAESSDPTLTNEQGRFSLLTPRVVSKVEKLDIRKEGYVLRDYTFDVRKRELNITVSLQPYTLEGKLTDLNNAPMPGMKLTLSPNTPNTAAISANTDQQGNFKLEVPGKVAISQRVSFLVNDLVVPWNYIEFNSSINFLRIKFNEAVASTPGPTEKAKSKVTSPTDQPVPAPSNPTQVPKTDNPINPVLVVVVYDEDITPANSLPVKVDSRIYVTDNRGEFKVFADSILNSNIEIENYEITRKYFDYADNYMFIQIRNPGSGTTADYDLLAEVTKENFEFIFQQLESEKQLLQETGQEIRKEITKITERLSREKVTDAQRQELEAYLNRLETALVENEVAFEEAQIKTREVLEKMRSQLLQQEETIEQISAEKQKERNRLMIILAIAMVSLSLLVVFYIQSRKIKKQHEELQKTYQILKDAQGQIMRAQDQLIAVRDIGQKFTTSLNFEGQMPTVQKSAHTLFDATIFGIGIFNEVTNTIDFSGMLIDGEIQPDFSDHLTDITRLSVWCFKNQEEVVVNDLSAEYGKFIAIADYQPGEHEPQSVVFVPLVVEDKPVGVLTIQSYQKDAYRNLNLSLLRTLGSYAAIAVSNSNAYKTIELKNKNITDSLRYAQKIQEAILPTAATMRETFVDYFVLYRSKEIVSGDFYWLSKVNTAEGEKIFIAVVDCTGHGVPGAFMTMIGNTLLNEIINQENIYDTVHILDMMNKGVKMALRQDDGYSNDDGMDICLCLLEKLPDGTTKVTFSGAKRPLYYYSAQYKKLVTLAGDVKSIGGIHKSRRNFSKKQVNLHPGDILYMTTDGFVDQNDPERRKFGTIKLIDNFTEFANRPMQEQKTLLEDALENHRKGVEQRDDITVLGIKII